MDGTEAVSPRAEPLLSELRAFNARGAFPSSVLGSLLAAPAAIAEVAQRLLDENFPSTLHQDILDAVGLSLEALQSSGARRRDPKFREAVLVAYQFRCAMCGLDMRIGSVTVGLEAAHIKWHQANGPDSVDNGFAFCTLHHKLFDLGAFTVGADHRVLVSEQVNGSRSVEEALFRYHGGAMTVPRRSEQLPRPEYLEWHLREVFKLNALP